MTIDEKFIAKQQKALLAEKQKLEKKMVELEKYPDYGSGDDDNAKEYEDFENNLSIEKQLKTLNKEITAALKTIDNGTYGKCSVCKKEIESDRLKSMPYAAVCVVCQKTKKK
ncbi:MAG: TraR/DksA family transcriptional regulator [Candidatus Berkelbacteria bacterium]